MVMFILLFSKFATNQTLVSLSHMFDGKNNSGTLSTGWRKMRHDRN